MKRFINKIPRERLVKEALNNMIAKRALSLVISYR